MNNNLPSIVKFLQGAITPENIADVIMELSTDHNIGAHSIFIGQVRADLIEGAQVSEIDYTINHEMAIEQMETICQTTFDQKKIEKIRIFHSVGKVAAGKICLMVLVGGKHRKATQEACTSIVEKIKNEIPIWGKEIFDNKSHQWKINK